MLGLIDSEVLGALVSNEERDRLASLGVVLTAYKGLSAKILDLAPAMERL